MPGILLSSAYMPPIHYFTAMACSGEVFIEQYDTYCKQTWRNRCLIGSQSGPLALTVPVVKPHPGQVMKDIRISDHGEWRRNHWKALESCYMNSPFFLYYMDDLHPFYEKRWEYLIDYNTEITLKLMELTGLGGSIRLTERFDRNLLYQDMRFLSDPNVLPSARVKPYWQVFKSRLGFMEGLSILDLLFNMGPETRLVLKDVESVSGKDMRAPLT